MSVSVSLYPWGPHNTCKDGPGSVIVCVHKWLLRLGEEKAGCVFDLVFGAPQKTNKKTKKKKEATKQLSKEATKQGSNQARKQAQGIDTHIVKHRIQAVEQQVVIQRYGIHDTVPLAAWTALVVECHFQQPTPSLSHKRSEQVGDTAQRERQTDRQTETQRDTRDTTRQRDERNEPRVVVIVELLLCVGEFSVDSKGLLN